MKFNSLKSGMKGVIAGAICVLAVACNDDSGNNSTTKSETTANDSSGSKTSPGMVAKKKGKASANMPAESTNEKMKKDEMGYYNFTEVLPAFNGGQPALESYIQNNIEYPQQAIDNEIQGTISVQFVVDENGNVSNVKTVGNKIGYGLEEEAVKVVSNMPKWTPGQVKGKYVKTKRTLPITYRLES